MHCLQAREKAVERAQQKLQMPPVMSAPVDKEEVISDDSDIAMFDKNNPEANYVFTDISMGIKRRVKIE